MAKLKTLENFCHNYRIALDKKSHLKSLKIKA